MANGRIPKDILYGELVTGTRTVGRPYLRYRDTCKRDMKVAGIDTTTWEAAADDRGHWRAVVKTGTRRGDETRIDLVKHKLINTSQHGFLKARSCLTNLLCFFEEITKWVCDGPGWLVWEVSFM